MQSGKPKKKKYVIISPHVNITIYRMCTAPTDPTLISVTIQTPNNTELDRYSMFE